MRLNLNKYSLLLLSIFLTILYSCSNKPKYFKEYTWYIGQYTLDENKNIVYKEFEFIKNDSIFIFSSKDSILAKYPIIKTEKQIIFTRKTSVDPKTLKEIKDTLLADTLFYDFKVILGHQIMAITRQNLIASLIVLKPDRMIENFSETNNNLVINEFKIGGIGIGDTLNDKDYTIDNTLTNFDKNILRAKLNKNIEVELIDKNIVFSIKQEMIEKEALTNIIDVINKKINILPDTIKMTNKSYTEGYKWVTTDMIIQLERDEMSKYFIDLAEKEPKGSIMRKIYLNAALEQINKDKYWTLSYENKLKQQVLLLYSDRNPVSNIIE